MTDRPAPLRAWHALVEAQDPARLDELLADNVEFRSPAVFAPQQGKALTSLYLSALSSCSAPRCGT